jgi:hypothetical protein
VRTKRSELIAANVRAGSEVESEAAILSVKPAKKAPSDAPTVKRFSNQASVWSANVSGSLTPQSRDAKGLALLWSVVEAVRFADKTHPYFTLVTIGLWKKSWSEKWSWMFLIWNRSTSPMP